MYSPSFSSILSFLILFSVTYAGRSRPPLPPPLVADGIPSGPSEIGVSHLLSKSRLGVSLFKQLIDHSKPKLGTFDQLYYYNYEHWAGPGSPIVLVTPGEAAAANYTAYLTNQTLTGLIAENIGAAVILLEHRYFGSSSPFDELTTENLQYLTINNAIADLVHFAQTVSLPFDPHGSSTASKAPWVLVGGSYAGNLAAWTAQTAPGTFWAYLASSAPVEAIAGYWEYGYPIYEGMAKNCSTDIIRMINFVDKVLTNGSAIEIQALKTVFGMGALKHDDDFASVFSIGPSLWQENGFTTGYSPFYEFCDYIEGFWGNDTNIDMPGEDGVGLLLALTNYAKWMKTKVVPTACSSLFGSSFGPNDISCLDSYNTSNPTYTDISVNSTINQTPAGIIFNRPWSYLVCNEPLGAFITGAPENWPSLFSRHITTAYEAHICALMFPPSPTFTPNANHQTVHGVNGYTRGWEISTERLLWVNGEFDPWREASVSSIFRPGGPLASTAKAPVLIVPKGFHGSDLLVANGEVNEGVRRVQEQEVRQIAEWVKLYPKKE